MKSLRMFTAFSVFVGLAWAGCGGSQKAPESSSAPITAIATPASTSNDNSAAADSAKAPVEESPVEAASGPECKKDEDCTIFADCCSCKAVPAAKPSPVPCESVCGESKCEVKGITIVNVACDAGRCVIKKKK